MLNQTTGEIGYHEAAKRLICAGYDVARPELDRGSDMVVCRDEECVQVQVKTVIVGEEGRPKTATWSGSENGYFDEKSASLVVIVLDEDLNLRYGLVFGRGEVPHVQSLQLNKNPKGKYAKYEGRWDSI